MTLLFLRYLKSKKLSRRLIVIFVDNTKNNAFSYMMYIGANINQLPTILIDIRALIYKEPTICEYPNCTPYIELCHLLELTGTCKENIQGEVLCPLSLA